MAVDHREPPLGGEQVRVFARHADGERPVLVDEADDLRLDLTGQHHPHDGHRLGGGDPLARAERRGDAVQGKLCVDLRTAAVHDDRVQAGVPQEHDVLGERLAQVSVGHRVPAVLHHDSGPGKACQPGQRLHERGRLGKR